MPDFVFGIFFARCYMYESRMNGNFQENNKKK